MNPCLDTKSQTSSTHDIRLPSSTLGKYHSPLEMNSIMAVIAGKFFGVWPQLMFGSRISRVIDEYSNCRPKAAAYRGYRWEMQVWRPWGTGVPLRTHSRNLSGLKGPAECKSEADLTGAFVCPESSMRSWIGSSGFGAAGREK